MADFSGCFLGEGVGVLRSPDVWGSFSRLYISTAPYRLSFGRLLSILTSNFHKFVR